MSNNEFTGIVGLVLFLFFGAAMIACGNIACSSGEQSSRWQTDRAVRAEALAAGAAHYETSTDGHTQFVWGPAPKECAK